MPSMGGTCLQLAQLSRSVAFLVFALVVLLHVVYFAFFPIMLFTLSTSCLLPSQEAVHCYSRLFLFMNCHSASEKPAVPSSLSFYC